MSTISIINHMIYVVESYIYYKKQVVVKINILEILSNPSQLDKLIDAFNHAKKQNFPSNPYLL